MGGAFAGDVKEVAPVGLSGEGFGEGERVVLGDFEVVACFVVSHVVNRKRKLSGFVWGTFDGLYGKGRML